MVIGSPHHQEEKKLRLNIEKTSLPGKSLRMFQSVELSPLPSSITRKKKASIKKPKTKRYPYRYSYDAIYEYCLIAIREKKKRRAGGKKRQLKKLTRMERMVKFLK